jgi:serine/threonine-protein kinase HipA
LNELPVHWGNELVGILRRSDDGLDFRYLPAWSAAGKSPLSQSMPVKAEPYGKIAQAFFSNLLPEEKQRDAWAKKFKLDPEDTFGLLEQMGMDCAGAISIGNRNESSPEKVLIGDEHLRHHQIQSWGLIEGQKPKFSLAGAQSKIGVLYENKQLYLPLQCPSTHILKFDSPDLPSALNEAFCTALAKAIGLPVPSVQVLYKKGQLYSLHQRYDRVLSEPVERIHQEDFAQAMGYANYQKYEDKGGPTLKAMLEFLMQVSTSKLNDKEAFLRWIIYNLIIRNGDAHCKNLSLLYQSNGSCTLAPFYDLICTHLYRGKIDVSMANSIGGVSAFDKVSKSNLAQLAKDCSVSEKYLLQLIAEMAKATEQKLPPLEQKFTEYCKGNGLKNGTVLVVKEIKASLKCARNWVE